MLRRIDAEQINSTLTTTPELQYLYTSGYEPINQSRSAGEVLSVTSTVLSSWFVFRQRVSHAVQLGFTETGNGFSTPWSWYNDTTRRDGCCHAVAIVVAAAAAAIDSEPNKNKRPPRRMRWMIQSSAATFARCSHEHRSPPRRKKKHDREWKYQWHWRTEQKHCDTRKSLPPPPLLRKNNFRSQPSDWSGPRQTLCFSAAGRCVPVRRLDNIANMPEYRLWFRSPLCRRTSRRRERVREPVVGFIFFFPRFCPFASGPFLRASFHSRCQSEEDKKITGTRPQFSV